MKGQVVQGGESGSGSDVASFELLQSLRRDAKCQVLSREEANPGPHLCGTKSPGDVERSNGGHSCKRGKYERDQCGAAADIRMQSSRAGEPRQELCRERTQHGKCLQTAPGGQELPASARSGAPRGGNKRK